MKWKVLSNPVGDKVVYQVYRLKRENEPMHSGNIETIGVIYEDELEAEAAADLLNMEEEDKQEICDLLLPALQATRDLHDLKSLTYVRVGNEEYVRAVFTSGYSKKANVTIDSGVAMIRDIARQIV